MTLPKRPAVQMHMQIREYQEGSWVDLLVGDLVIAQFWSYRHDLELTGPEELKRIMHSLERSTICVLVQEKGEARRLYTRQR